MSRRRWSPAIGPAAWFALSSLALLLIATVVGPVFFDRDPNAIALNSILEPPSMQHLFGTDELGRDVFTRLLHGGRVSLVVGITTAALAITVGTMVGAVAGFLGGWLDEAISRTVDMFLSFPVVPVALVASAFLTLDVVSVTLLISALSWMQVARLVRGHVIALRERDFVVAAETLGATNAGILFRHLIPNTVPVILVAATLLVPFAILLEAALSFLGHGVQPPTPTWGNMLQSAPRFMRDAPWLAVAPGLLITWTVASFTIIGDTMRRVMSGAARPITQREVRK